MVLAVASPHVDILGHCTGRMIGKRPPSTFDADYRVRRLRRSSTRRSRSTAGPSASTRPTSCSTLALDYGCWFSIDTDAHATGQLEWQPHGCDRAAERRRPDRADHQHDVRRRPPRLDRSLHRLTRGLRRLGQSRRSGLRQQRAVGGHEEAGAAVSPVGALAHPVHHVGEASSGRRGR